MLCFELGSASVFDSTEINKISAYIVKSFKKIRAKNLIIQLFSRSEMLMYFNHNEEQVYKNIRGAILMTDKSIQSDKFFDNVIHNFIPSKKISKGQLTKLEREKIWEEDLCRLCKEDMEKDCI